MLETITRTVREEVDKFATSAINNVQRKLLRVALKTFFIIAGLASVCIGLIALGSKYVGFDLMMLLVGVVLLLAFFLS